MGREWPLSIEILAPVLASYTVDDFEAGIDAYVAVRRDKHSSTPPPAPRGRFHAGTGPLPADPV